MPRVELIGTVEHPEIVVDASFLDVGALSCPSDLRCVQPIGPGAIGAERCSLLKPGLQGRQDGAVEDGPLQIDPLPIEFSLDPGMKDVPGRNRIDQLRHDPALQTLVDGKAMKAAGDAQAAQKRHQQRALGVALPVPIDKDTRGWQRIIRVVAKENFNAHEIVGRADPLGWRQRRPATGRDQVLDRRSPEIEKRGIRKIVLRHLTPLESSILTR